MWAVAMSDRALKVIEDVLANREKPLQERFPWAEIGVGTYGGLQVMRWNAETTLFIGKYTSIAHEVKVVLGGEHNINWVTTYPFSALAEWPTAKDVKGHPGTKGDVHIGSDVWIGVEAMILSGVTIGDGAVIGARAVVTKDVAPYTIVGGHPAKVVRGRFGEWTIEKLLKIKWWDWERARIERALPWLLRNDTETFLKMVDQGEL